MAISSWDESMETGNIHMDRQHREIMDLVDRLDALDASDMGWMGVAYEILDTVMHLTVEHFMTEEHLMDEVDYPADARAHMLEQHDDFKAYARLRVLEFRSGDQSGLGLLPGFLRVWLVEHEFGLDRELVSWIRGRSEHGAVARV